MRHLLATVAVVAVWAALMSAGQPAETPRPPCLDVRAGEHVVNRLGSEFTVHFGETQNRPDLDELTLAADSRGWELPDGSRLFRTRNKARYEECTRLSLCAGAYAGDEVFTTHRGRWSESEQSVTVTLDYRCFVLHWRAGELYANGRKLKPLPQSELKPASRTVWPAGLRP